jgi:hypothetical protein
MCFAYNFIIFIAINIMVVFNMDKQKDWCFEIFVKVQVFSPFKSH